MDDYVQLCTVIDHIFHYSTGLEQKLISKSQFKNISVNDMHILDVIGMDASKNMSSVAKTMGVTVGTLTIAINALVKKGYVVRQRSEKDRRVVLISLSQMGKQALAHHYHFLDDISNMIAQYIDIDQCKNLTEALKKTEKQFLIRMSKEGNLRE